jgi:hypothetical protein
MEIIELTNSPKEGKRFRVVMKMDDGKEKHFDFGAEGGSTYIDEGDKKKRENYWLRHLANKTERHRIENVIPSPATFSAWLLWGESSDLCDNLVALNKYFKRSK